MFSSEQASLMFSSEQASLRFSSEQASLSFSSEQASLSFEKRTIYHTVLLIILLCFSSEHASCYGAVQVVYVWLQSNLFCWMAFLCLF